MYLFSLPNHRIEYKIDLDSENILSTKIDPYGFFIETQSVKTPRKIYRIDFDQLVFQRFSIAPTVSISPMLWKESKIPNVNVSKFKVQHDSFHSFDQIKVPLTIIQKTSGGEHRKKPCLVFAYGGFGIPMLPLYKLFFLFFIEIFNGVVGSY